MRSASRGRASACRRQLIRSVRPSSAVFAPCRCRECSIASRIPRRCRPRPTEGVSNACCQRILRSNQRMGRGIQTERAVPRPPSIPQQTSPMHSRHPSAPREHHPRGLCAHHAALAAQQTLPTQKVTAAHEAAPVPSAAAVLRSSPIAIDGKLDEEAWRAATPITQLRQTQPGEGDAGHAADRDPHPLRRRGALHRREDERADGAEPASAPRSRAATSSCRATATTARSTR